MDTKQTTMKVSDTITYDMAAWQDNYEGFVKHQDLLKKFAQLVEEKGIKILIPEEQGGWDLGIDLIVYGTHIRENLDMKACGLQRSANGNTYSWNSKFYDNGKEAPVYDTSETHWFVHPNGPNVNDWYVCRGNGLRTSHNGSTPFYYSNDVFRVDEWLLSNSFE